MKKTRAKKYPFHKMNVGDYFVAEWDREQVEHDPRNYNALRMAVDRANKNDLGKKFTKEGLWHGMKITRVR